MKFINNIGLYSFLILAITILILFTTFSYSGGSILNFIWPFILAAFVGAIIGLVRHRSKLEIVFSVLTIIFFVGIVMLLIGAGMAFHD